ncbi:MAG: fibronectin type III domain-containing protein [Bacteroidota bacterium]
MTKRTFHKIFLIVLFNFLGLYGFSTTYNVSNSTDLKNALSSAIAGDVILLAPGTYTTAATTASFPTGDGGTVNRGFFFRGVNNGNSSNKITLKSANPANPAVLSGSGTNNSGYVLYITGDYWVVEDIKITNGAKGLILDNANHAIIRGVEIFNIGQEGLHVRDGSSHTLIDNINLHDIGTRDDGFGEGIYIGSDNSVWWEGNGSTTGENGRYYRRAANNTTVKNSTIGPNITAEPFDIKEGTENTVVENCVIYGSGISGNNFADSHIDLKGNTARIRCNTFYQNNNNKIKRGIMIVPRISAGVSSALTANDNYIHDNTFNLDGSSVDMVIANSGSNDTYAWNNTRNPSSGDDYNSRVNQSQPSNYSASCGNATSCDAPNGLSVSNITSSSARLNWTSVSGASNYDVRYRENGTGSWTNVSNLSGLNRTLTGLSSNTTYNWQIRTSCSSSNSSYASGANFTTSGTSTGGGGNTEVVYDDNLASGWGNYSFSGSYNLSHTTNVQVGARAIRASYGSYGGLNLKQNNFDLSGFSSIRFWVKGEGNYLIRLKLDSERYEFVTSTSWQQITIPLSEFGNLSEVDKITFQNRSSSSRVVYYDQIEFVGSGSPARISDPDLAYSDSPTLTVFPNPVTTSHLEIKLEAHRFAGIATLRIVDLMGREILQREVHLKEGMFHTQLDLPTTLQKGYYFLSIDYENRRLQKSIMVE